MASTAKKKPKNTGGAKQSNKLAGVKANNRKYSKKGHGY
jgi:hypothetical protein